MLAQFLGHECWKIEESVLLTSFFNIGMLFHPAITPLSLARMQGAEKFMFYTDGTSEIVANLIYGLDMKKLAVGKAYGVKRNNVQAWIKNSYGVDRATVFEALQNNDVCHGLAASNQLTMENISRLCYITEDVPCGLVSFSEFDRHAKVETPHMDAVILLASQLRGRNFRVERRALAHFGLAEKNRRRNRVNLRTYYGFKQRGLRIFRLTCSYPECD